MKLLIVLMALCAQTAFAYDLIIWDQPRSQFSHNSRFSAEFSANVGAQTGSVKMIVAQTEYVSPRNLPIIRRQTYTLPLEGLMMVKNDLVFENVLCGTVRTTTNPGPRSTIFYRKLILNGNCRLKTTTKVVNGSRRVQVRFTTR